MPSLWCRTSARKPGRREGTAGLKRWRTQAVRTGAGGPSGGTSGVPAWCGGARVAGRRLFGAAPGRCPPRSRCRSPGRGPAQERGQAGRSVLPRGDAGRSSITCPCLSRSIGCLPLSLSLPLVPLSLVRSLARSVCLSLLALALSLPLSSSCLSVCPSRSSGLSASLSRSIRGSCPLCPRSAGTGLEKSLGRSLSCSGPGHWQTAKMSIQ